jgi:hypothetical protein
MISTQRVIPYKGYNFYNILTFYQNLLKIKSKNPQPHAVVDLPYGGDPRLSKTSIRRRVAIRMFGVVFELQTAAAAA